MPTQEELEEEDLPMKALTHMETVPRARHGAFLKQVWPLLVPRHKWSTLHPGVKVGNVGSIVETSKYGKATWQACRVLALLPDRKGVVRLVTIKVRSRDGLRDGKAKYHARPLSEMNIGVQRLAVTLPLCDQATDSADSADPTNIEILEEQEAVKEASGKEEQVSDQGGLLAGWQGGRIPRCDQVAVPSNPSDIEVLKRQGDGGEEALGQETQALARGKRQVARRKRQEEEGRL